MKLKRIAMCMGAVLCWGSSVAMAAARIPLSSKRGVKETYKEAANRSLIKLKNFGQEARLGASAFDVRVSSFEEIDLTKVPEIGGLEKLQAIFETYRDKRYLPDPEDATFLRRLSWMYPDDGCFARAELLARLSENDLNPAAAKLFVFGDLQAPTPNHPAGEVRWWYHVAAAYRIGSELFVMDPSVEPKKPITDREWGERVGDRGTDGRTSLEWSLCATRAIDPGADCRNPMEESEGYVKRMLAPYLEAERDRAVELGRVANDVLGDLPPWLDAASTPQLPEAELQSP